MTSKPKKTIKKVLDFKANPVEVLTLDELEQTASERNSGNKPIFGVEHHELFGMIIAKMTSMNVQYDVQKIYASDGGEKSFRGASRLPYMEKDFGEKSLQSWLLRRIIGSIHLKQGASKESVGSVGISFHQRGIQISYGQHIKLCKNMSIYGIKNVMSTYGEEYNKIPNITKMIEVVGDWVAEHELKRARDLKIIKRMKETSVNYQKACEIIGEMSVLRIGKDILRTEKHYALSQTQITKFTERYVRDFRENPENVNNLWKLYNMGTQFHKPGETDIPLIVPNNVTLSDYLINKFKLEN
ncbi:MAG: hypothetical protein H8E51_07045 [Bacteroidetes bacterium]|nr:hypothetical protein [Bacteroidota bacterium]